MVEGNTTLYPLWEEVVQIIVERVKKEGDGIIIPLTEILQLLKLNSNSELLTSEQWETRAMEKFAAIELIKEELLTGHKICLVNRRGEGYVVLAPNDQVKIIPKIQYEKVKKNIKKIIKIFRNIDETLLNDGSKKRKQEEENKAAFFYVAVDKPLKNIDDIKVKKVEQKI